MQNTHVINDPIHGIIQVGNFDKNLIKPIIDHPHMQRLRHIKQLGFAEIVFPGATHNRFSHSIGSSLIAKKISAQLNLDDETTTYATLAALLHDIGHGPLSHAFEKLIPTILQDKELIIYHETWAKYFLYDLKNDLKNYEIDFDFIANIIYKNSDNANSLIKDIITSQLDADRLDYLLRDSHFCGVPYGNYDHNWLIHCMSIVEQDGKQRLGITKKGIAAAEHYILARRLMTKNIYYHPKIQAFDYLVVQFLNLVYQEIIVDEKKNLIKDSILGKFLYLIGKITKDNQEQIIPDAYSYYKLLADYDLYNLIREIALSNSYSKNLKSLACTLYYRKLPKTIKINDNSVIEHIKSFKHAHNIPDWQLAILEPFVVTYHKDKQPILIAGGNNSLATESIIINSISNKAEISIHLLISDDLPDLLYSDIVNIV